MRIRLWRESIPWIWVSERLPEEPLRVTILGFLREYVPHRFVSRVVQDPLGNDVHLGGGILDQFLFPGAGDDNDLSVQSCRRELDAQIGRSALLQIQVLRRAVESGHGRGDLVTPLVHQELESALIAGDLVNLKS